MADADNHKIKIKDLALFVRNVQLSPTVRMGHVKAFEKTSCKYPIRRVEVKVDTVPRGNMNYVQDNMYNLRFQSRIVTFGGNLSFAHVQCHKIDLVVSKIERDFRNSPI
jgi:hypothetical protein